MEDAMAYFYRLALKERHRNGDADPKAIRDNLREAVTIAKELAPYRHPRLSSVVERADDRRVFSGIVQVLKSGCRWCDCPPEYGPPTTIYNRFVRWARRGVWENLFRQLAGNGRSINTQMIDSTHIKAHRSAAGGKGGSRSRLLAARAEGETRRFMHSQMLRDDLSPSC
jgi:transposase